MPDVEGCQENKCGLTRTPYGRRFISEVCIILRRVFFFFLYKFSFYVNHYHFVVKSQELNSYIKFLFELIVARGPSVGFNVSLNRYDLFHGHVFIARETGRLGIL